MTKVLILMPCSGSKRKSGEANYNESTSILHYLTDSVRQKLLYLRKQLFEYFCISFGKEVGQNENTTTGYMEAYKRYSGQYSQIYRQISSSSWEELGKNANLDIIIISALYGLLRYDESIQYYDKRMKDKVGIHTLKAWWRCNGLGEVLKDYINKNSISELHFVLSNDYMEAISDCTMNLNVKCIYHDFSKYKSGSNANRGNWINSFIQSY